MFSIISSLKLATVLQTLLFSLKLSPYLLSRCKQDNFQVSVPSLVSRRTISISWSLAAEKLQSKPAGHGGCLLLWMMQERGAQRGCRAPSAGGARSRPPPGEETATWPFIHLQGFCLFVVRNSYPFSSKSNSNLHHKDDL